MTIREKLKVAQNHLGSVHLGAPAYEGKWPWLAALIFNNSQYCAGSILDNKWIVTTAHCFHGKYIAFGGVLKTFCLVHFFLYIEGFGVSNAHPTTHSEVGRKLVCVYNMRETVQ